MLICEIAKGGLLEHRSALAYALLYSFINLSVLFVADLFHPVDDLAVELFLNGDVRHGGGRRGAVPVLLAGREPDHIAGPDFLDRPALALRPAAAGRDDQGLAERMRVPCGARARLERDAGAGTRAGSGAWNSGSIRTVPVNQSAGPLPEGCEPIRLISIRIASRYWPWMRCSSWDIGTLVSTFTPASALAVAKPRR